MARHSDDVVAPRPSSAAPAPARVRVAVRSAPETRALAGCLADVARPGDRIALHGPLGAGKTEFAKGFAAALGVAEVVISPSFTLMAEYRGRLPLFHLDLFRLAGLEEAFAGGLLDERQAAGVTLIEWAERLDRAVDPGRLEVTLALGAGPDERLIELADPGSAYGRYLRAAEVSTGAVGP